MDDDDNTPIVQAHRYARQAIDATYHGHWQQAIDKHIRASQAFTELTTVTREKQALIALHLLAKHHSDNAQHIQRTLYQETIPRNINNNNNTITNLNTNTNTSTNTATNTSLIPTTSSTTTSSSSTSTYLQQFLSYLKYQHLNMEQNDFNIMMSTFQELSKIVTHMSIPSQAVRKSQADIENDLQSHLAYGREILTRIQSLSHRPSELQSTIHDVLPTLIRQHASLAQNESKLQHENDALRSAIQEMQQTYIQRANILNNALTTSFRPIRNNTTTPTTITTTTTPQDNTMLLENNKLLSDKMKLEKQVHILSKQLKAEMGQVKKQNAIIEEQNKRWHNLKEAARTKRERERNRIAGIGTAPANMTGIVTGTNTAPSTSTSTSTSTVPSSSTSTSSATHRPTLSTGSVPLPSTTTTTTPPTSTSTVKR